MPRLTDSMLTFLTSVAGFNHRAWGAVIDEPGGPIGAGVVRWVRSRKDPAVADMAVTVIDDYQGRGLGGLLLDVAVLDAFAHGVERFEGVVLGENVSSRRMLARGGATLAPDGGGVMTFTLPLRSRVERLRHSPLPALIARQKTGRGQAIEEDPMTTQTWAWRVAAVAVLALALLALIATMLLGDGGFSIEAGARWP
jgi:GNAT superfamily N-acetyltransferase